MKFFLSGELDVQIGRLWSRTSNRVERKLNRFFLDQDYGSAIKSIAIIPVIMRPEWQADFPERRLFQRKKFAADYRTWIDFERVRSGSDELREKLLLANIIEAVSDLKRKAGAAFDGERLIEDLLKLFKVTREELGK